MKKAFELQFHWMFIMIAGALILGFFVKIGLQQKDITETRNYIDYIKKLDASFNTIIHNPNIPIDLSIGNDLIYFNCDKSCNCNYSVAKVTQNFNEKIIFAPEKITQKLHLFSFDWNIPFRATNFLYITDTSKKYLIIYDDSDTSRQLFEIIKDKIPKSINHQFININELKQIKNEKLDYKIIFLNTNVIDLDKSFDDKTLSGVVITKTNVEFLVKGINQGFSKIADYQIIPFEKNTIIAAIISDKDLFKCGMLKAFEKLSYVAKVYEQKSQNKELTNFEASRCAGSYATAKELFKQLSDKSKKAADSQLSQSINLPLIDIKKIGENIERDSCPRII